MRRFSNALGMESISNRRSRLTAEGTTKHLGEWGVDRDGRHAELLHIEDKYGDDVKHVLTCPNGAVFVTMSWSPASKQFPIAMEDVQRHHRTIKMSTACFIGFVFLEMSALYLIFAYAGWWHLHPLQSIVLCLESVCANGLYVALGGGVAGLRRAVDPGYISPDGREVDVPLLRTLQPKWQAAACSPTSTRGDDDNEGGSSHSFLEPVMCRTCCRVRPIRAKHCHDCGRCVGRFDHHCHWLGTCVAGRNRLHFLLLIVAMLAAIGHGMLILLVSFFAGHGGSSAHQQPQCASFCQTVFVAVIIFGVFSFILVLFTSVMQLGAINENTSSYDLFYTKEKVLTIVHPHHQRRMTVNNAFQRRDGLGNVSMYFQQLTQPLSWDCINAGRELIPSSIASNDRDRQTIHVRAVV